MDNYQAVFDAIRSRFHCDVDAAVRQAVSESFASADQQIRCIAQEFAITADDQRRPSVMFRPRLSIDGNQWCALYGDNLQDGVAGFGNSPSAAMHDFDRAWATNLPAARAAAKGNT